LVGFLATSLSGLGSGEHLMVDIRVGAGRDLVLTGQGPTSLLSTTEPVSYSSRMELAAGANLTYLPWVTIPFRGSRSQTVNVVAVGPGAAFYGWEILSTGRVGFGEELEFDALLTDWRVSREETLIEERVDLHRDQRAQIGVALGGATHCGTIYLVAPAGQLPPLKALQAVADKRIGISQLASELIVVKGLGDSAEELESKFWPIVQVAREARGLPPLPPGAIGRRWTFRRTDRGEQVEARPRPQRAGVLC
jgi:urease accessory protein